MKPIIYQLLPRLFTNATAHCVPSGTIEQNGCGKLNDITPAVLDSIRKLGATHVWYTGVIEHATKTDYSRFGINRDNPNVVKGQAGSPYAIKDYYDIDPDLAVDVAHRMEEFEALVGRTHAAGMKVVIDFVPNHVARQYHSDAKPVGIEDLGQGDDTTKFFSPTNNFYYITRQQFAPQFSLGEGAGAYIEFPAKATGNDCFTAFPTRNDWYETVKLNYGHDYGDHSCHYDPIPPTWLKMLHILRFWASKGIDAFRCDMAFMVPIEFWQWAIANVKQRYPNLKFIAEIYDVGLYRPFIEAGFDYLYDKVNLYDTLRSVQTRCHSAATITNCWQTVDGIEHHMLNFLENHDEQRFGSPQYAGDPALVAPSLIVSSMIGTGPFMLYAGQELGEQALDAEGFSGADGRTTIFDYWSLSTFRRWLDGGNCAGSELTDRERQLRDFYSRVLNLCNSEAAIASGRFFDLMYVNYDNPDLNPHRQYAFLRATDAELLVVTVNFDATPRNVRLRIPRHAFEVLDLPEGRFMATELLTGRRARKTLSSSATFETMVEPFGATIWKIRTKRQKKSSAPDLPAAPADPES